MAIEILVLAKGTKLGFESVATCLHSAAFAYASVSIRAALPSAALL
jgi:hypothetical protein